MPMRGPRADARTPPTRPLPTPYYTTEVARIQPWYSVRVLRPGTGVQRTGAALVGEANPAETAALSLPEPNGRGCAGPPQGVRRRSRIQHFAVKEDVCNAKRYVSTGVHRSWR